MERVREGCSLGSGVQHITSHSRPRKPCTSPDRCGGAHIFRHHHREPTLIAAAAGAHA